MVNLRRRLEKYDGISDLKEKIAQNQQNVKLNENQIQEKALIVSQ